MTATTNTPNNALLIRWAGYTTVIGAVLSILSAHGFYFFPLLAFVGFAIGLAQWLLLRGKIEKAWRWVLTSTFGWVLAIIITFGVIYGIAFALVEQDVSPFLVMTLQIVVYPVLFGILGAAQAITLHRRGINGTPWILANALGGLLLGVALAGVCAAGGGTLFAQAIILQPDVVGAYCVNIGLTIPRLQTAEPIFNVAYLSFFAHIAGWLVYAVITAFSMNQLLTNRRAT